MDEILRQLMGYLRSIWQRRWIGLALAWIVGVVGVVVVLRMPDKFEADARIYVDTWISRSPSSAGL
jgi:uncharacterized protein involved in exopolysaccharide biosynthesis